MNPETPFLDAIRAEPTNVACRLVYADWLEERGDPRAELIRIEEEMRPLPVFCDRFWQLKPRRYELLQKLPMDWLETMGYGIDCCPPTFRHLPVTLKDWWRLIRVFTERWYPFPLLPDVGGRPVEIRAAEDSLRRELPPSVREWVAFAHDVRTEDHEVLRRRHYFHLGDMQDFPALAVLRWPDGENDHGETVWAVQHQDLVNPDPPVWEYERYEVGGRFFCRRQNPMAHTLSSFALAHSLSHARGMLGYFVCRHFSYDSESYREEALRSIPAHYSLPVEYLDTIRIDVFEKENLLVLVEHKREAADALILFGVTKPVASEAMPVFMRAEAGILLKKSSQV